MTTAKAAIVAGACALCLFLVLFLPLYFGDQITSHSDQVQVAKVRACSTLPVDQRARCVNPPAPPSTREQVCANIANNHATADFQSTFQQCVYDRSRQGGRP